MRTALPKGTVYTGDGDRRFGTIAVQTPPQRRSIPAFNGDDVDTYFVALPSLIFVVSYYDLLFALIVGSLRVFMANGPLRSPSDPVRACCLPMHRGSGSICLGNGSKRRRFFRDRDSLVRGVQSLYWSSPWNSPYLARHFEYKSHYIWDLWSWSQLTRGDRDLVGKVDWVDPRSLSFRHAIEAEKRLIDRGVYHGMESEP